MTIVEPTPAATAGLRVPSDAERAALAAGDHYVDLYVELTGTVDATSLRRAIDTALAECPVLHSVFRRAGGAIQVSETAVAPTAVHIVETAEPEEFLGAWLADERARPMDSGQGPLYRQAVFQFGNGRIGWYQRYHRLINDQAGMLAIVARVRDLLDGTPAQPGPNLPFGSTSDRLDHEHRYRESGAWAADRAYWEQSLAEAARPETLPSPVVAATGVPAVSDSVHGVATGRAAEPLWVRVEGTSELARIARVCGGGAPAVVLAAMAVYGSRLLRAGECAVAFDTGETVVPMRITVPAQASFDTVAKQVGRALRTARRHRYIPDIDEPWADSPVHGQWPLTVRMLGGAAVDRIGTAAVSESCGAGAGFTVGVDDRAVGGWRIAVAGAHRSHRDRLVGLLERLARTPHTPLAHLDIAAPGEIEQLAGERSAAATATLAELFAEQASRSPEATALVGPGLHMTYADLHGEANRLARSLIGLGVGPERPVALAFGPSAEQIVAIHAVLAAGGAYLPLDPEHPRERQARVLDIARPVCVLSTRRAGFEADGVPVIYVDELDLSGASAAPIGDAERLAPLRPENLAYVLFTSGSTGQPKGVAVTHAAVCTHLAWMQHLHGLDDSDTVVRKTALTFDVSAWEVLWPFTTGARLVIDGTGTQGDAGELARAMSEHGVTTVQFTPSTLGAYRRAVAAPLPSSVRRLLLAGEAVTPALAAALPTVAADARHDNLYGPTEATVAVTRHAIDGSGTAPVPIGAPAWEVRAHVLDACLRPVPAGLPGELYLGGATLARGYVRRPALTAARFIADPFGPAGQRLYRTGDIVRSTGHGELEFLGRSDFQVKLRGIRIELGELESVLAAEESVAQAIAVVHDGSASAAGGARLVAYVTAAAGHTIDTVALDERLRAVLPRHLVPATIIALPELPVNRSGKVDRKALPAPEFAPVAFRAPRSETETALAAAFAEVLGRDGIGVDESFFALGGDSIMSILLVSRARARGIAVTAQQVYEHRTVARLAAIAETAGGEEIPPLVELPGGGVGELPLTPVIRFLVERGGTFDRFCQSMTLDLPAGIDRGALVSTISAVVDHHDMLRSRLYRDDSGEWHVQVSAPGSVDVDALIDQVVHDADLDGEELRALAAVELNAAVDRIDPSTGSVLRFVWLRPDSGDASGMLVIAAHHIAVDGVSWRILLPDFIAAWAAVAAGNTPQLPAVGTSMRRWAHALVDTAHSDTLTTELPIWREIVEGPDPWFGARSFDPQRDMAADVAHRTVELDEADTAAILTAIPDRYRARVADALLTALALAVARWRSRRAEPERSVLLRLEGHGREQDAVRGTELSRTVGWFTSIVPARLDLTGVDLVDAFAGGPAMGVAIKAVKEQLRATPHNGFGYGLLRYLNQDTAAALPPGEPGQISFNYFGHITGLDIPDELAGIGFLPSTEFGMLAIRPDARRGALGAVEVDSIVLGHRLVTSFGYARGIFGETAGAELVGLWREALHAVAEHARAPHTHGGHTPSDFPLVTVTQGDIDGWERRYPTLSDIWPVTPLQAGMIFHALFDPGAIDVYTVQLVLSLEGEIDAARLRDAAAAVLERHPNLRAAFAVDATGAPVQIITGAAELPWREVVSIDTAGEYDRLLAAERTTPFDLAAPPLLRFLLLRLGDGPAQFVVTCHHLLLDGWSIPLLLREIMAGYAGFTAAAPRPYRHYVEWLGQQDSSVSRQAWAQALAGLDEPTLLADATEAHAPDTLPLERDFALDEAQTRAVARLAAEFEVTINTVVQAAWAILLAHSTDRSDIVFGTTVSGRPADLAGVEDMVGLFINTIPVRIRLDAGESVGALLRRVQREQFELTAHHHLGLPDIGAQAGLDARSLFDTLLVVESYPVDAAKLRADALAYAGLTIDLLRSREATHYALTLTVRHTDRLHIQTGWRPDLVDEASVVRLGEQLTRILAALAANPNTAVAEIDSLGDVERGQVLREWQRDSVRVPEASLVDLFRAQAIACGEAVAVRFGDSALTYRELDAASDAVAQMLAEWGVGAESLVAVGISRSTELIAALLGVLKSGAGYVPLDLENPLSRLEYLLAETNPVCVLTTAADRAALPQTGIPRLLVGDAHSRSSHAWGSAESSGAPSENDRAAADLPPAGPSAHSRAYVLYTSGSTGRPKGVSVTHRNVVAMLAATRAMLETDSSDVWTMFHSYAFDFSVWEMWGALTSGGTLVVVDATLTRAPAEFAELLAHEGVTVLSQTPAAFGALLDAGLRRADVPALRHVVLGGEAVDPRRLRPWFDADPTGETRISNLYGITEATVHATQVTLDRTHAGSTGASLIGRGLPGMTVRVLDSRLRPSAVGVRGELYLTGPQLAQGYHGRPATTAERYVADPYGAPGTRMYRTGDLARWNSEGQLEYLGRADQQVKIRGYRIEPGEIEAALREHESVARAAVVARAAESGAMRLIAYVVPASLGDPASEVSAVLEMHIAQRVPSYMRPAAIVVLDALPLTRNGKLDLAALPNPVLVPRSSSAPRTPAEQLVAELFAEVLGVAGPGVDDSFFALGGDSIISIQLASRARARGLHVTPREVFEQRTVAGIAAVARVSDSADETARLLPELPGGGIGDMPLTPVVRWLTERGGGFRRVNQSLTVELPAGTEYDALVSAVAALLDRHDMLRGKLFRDDVEEWRFETTPPDGLDASKLLRRSTFEDALDADAIQGLAAAELDAALDRLDPAAGVLVQFVWLEAERGSVPGRLLICAHHLAVDGVSWRILLPDLFTALTAAANGTAPQLDPVGTSMRRWAHALVDAAHSRARTAELAGWRQICATPDPLLGLRAFDPAIDTSARLATVEVAVDEALTDALVRMIPARFHAGVDEVLIAALAVALAVWRADRGVDAPVSLLRLEGHGREEQLAPGADLSRTVGWFTSLYPVRIDLSELDIRAALGGTDAAGSVLKATKEQLRAIPDHGIGFGLLRYLNPDTAEQLPEQMPGQIAFNYLGRIDGRGAGVLATPEARPDADLPAAATLEVNAVVTGCRLRAGFAYPTTLLDEAAVTELAQLWVTALGAFARHARSAHAGGHTPSDFPLVRVSGDDITGWERDYGRLTDVWPLAPLQSGLFFHATVATAAQAAVADVYNVQTVVRLGGTIDRARLRQAGQRILERHANLRAAFVYAADGTPCQVVPESAELPWREVTLAEAGELTDLVTQERARRFDPARPPLMRFTLANLGEAGCVLLVTYHHILLDGWSVPLILRDLMALYGSGAPLPAPSGSFRDYLAWNHTRDAAAATRAWRRALDGVHERTLVAPDTRTRQSTVTTADHRWSLDRDTTAALGATAIELGVTLNTVVQVAWAILLGRKLGRGDVVFGATVSGRPPALPGVESIVGLFINTVPVRVRFGPDLPVAELLRTVQAEQAEMIEHHQLGLTDIHAAAGLRDLLFDTVLAFESYPLDAEQLSAAAAALDGVTGAGLEITDAAHYPLSVTVDPGAELAVRIGYLREVFDETHVAEICATMRALLTAIARHPYATIEELA
ncbi:amino acid adenylation domain-containing protein [Nocardia huaxiensis]|uniref:Amino acid adenylation domain-containing protein n=1 Tax=Nocardia huaxiensis TaxID=2755382 RepID=A0A7D6VEC9_9NOCA|nr:non-ribosomal peptide synthetase [Nocardia huaxiensis]QLY28176.1 amino acid adenylation domain-containing protein [Nocardia huaxiensis]